MIASAISIFLSYLLGCVPTGLWLGLWLRRVDIREHGSKNIGATNTLRVLGKGLGAAALAGDMGKGIVSVLLVSKLSDSPYAAIACGIAAIVGHSASIFLKFRGGKGVATSAGVFMALAPLATLIAAVVFFVTVKSTRMVSAGSIAAALILAVSTFMPFEWVTWPTNAIPAPWLLRAAAFAIAVLVVVKHRTNIQRILRGEENKI
jgi:glycerol-3-phosphate acyltransferase PlsY